MGRRVTYWGVAYLIG